MAKWGPRRVPQEARLTISLSKLSEVINNSDDLIQEIILGDLKAIQIPWIEVLYAFDREGITNNHTMTLRVQVHPSRLPQGRKWKHSSPQEWAVKAHIEGSKFGTMEMEVAERLAFDTIKSLASQLAPSLYEIDPRIGMTLAGEGGGDVFPACPLFDPPSHIRRPRTGFHYYRQVVDWAQRAGLPRSSHPGGTPMDDGCVFCGQSVIIHPYPEEIVWGGGNIGWVHLACAPWLEPYHIDPRDLITPWDPEDQI